MRKQLGFLHPLGHHLIFLSLPGLKSPLLLTPFLPGLLQPLQLLAVLVFPFRPEQLSHLFQIVCFLPPDYPGIIIMPWQFSVWLLHNPWMIPDHWLQQPAYQIAPAWLFVQPPPFLHPVFLFPLCQLLITGRQLYSDLRHMQLKLLCSYRGLRQISLPPIACHLQREVHRTPLWQSHFPWLF